VSADGSPLRQAARVRDLVLAVADLYKLSPLWWALHRDEQKLMLGTSPASSDRALVLIDEELAQVTGYSPMAKEGEAWLFKALPHKLDAKTFTGCKVFEDDPAETTLKQMPPAVIEILTQHATCAAAAGGAVLGGVARFIEHGSDVDIFLYGLDHDGSAAVLRQIDELMQSERYVGVYDVSRSNAAITYTKKDAKKVSKEEQSFPQLGNAAANKDAWLLDRPFQIILGLHRARSQIVEYFDLQPCKVHMPPREGTQRVSTELTCQLGRCTFSTLPSPLRCGSMCLAPGSRAHRRQGSDADARGGGASLVC